MPHSDRGGDGGPCVHEESRAPSIKSFSAGSLLFGAALFRRLIAAVMLLSVAVTSDRKALYTENGDFLPHVRLAKDLTDQKRYDNRVRPVINHSSPTRVSFSMSLYQILAINEKMQNVDLNVWVIQKWRDEFLGWNPSSYGLINSTILPYHLIWLPDTYLYNSVVMNREETERYINVVVNTEYWRHERGAQIKFMYPALYRTSCRIQIRFFPYDQQNCTLIISSWTSDKSSIDYVPEFDTVNLDNFIPNEEWVIVSFNIRRIEEKFVCCPQPWVLLEASLVVRRKPLYYIVNLVIPTSVITLVAVTGFFTPASTSNERREKLSLGIDSLLAMSILMMMVSEQMPTTSDYVPLFGLFYLSIIFIIFVGTLFTAFILNIHLQKVHNKPIPPLVAYIFFHKVAPFLAVQPSTTLLELWTETGVRIRGLATSTKQRRRSNQVRRRQGGKLPRSMHHYQNEPPPTTLTDNATPNNITADADLFVWPNNSNNKNISTSNNFGGGKVRPRKWKMASVSPEIERRVTAIAQRLRGVDDVAQQRLDIELNADEKRCSLLLVDALSYPSPINASNWLSSSPSPSTVGDGGGSRGDTRRRYYGRSETVRSPMEIRERWRDVAARSLEKRRDELGRRHQLSSVRSIFNDIPYADISPGRPSAVVAVNSDDCASLSPSPRAPPNATPTSAPPFRGGVGGTGMLTRDAAMFDSKLRRRYAHEWEFLASVLDRVLLIVFSALVALVTAAMLIVGEAIHLSYDFQEHNGAAVNDSTTKAAVAEKQDGLLQSIS